MVSNENIFQRIAEIIELSNSILNESNNTREFVIIRHFKIIEDYAEEFNDLLDRERTLYLISQNKDNDVLENNNELKKLCKSKINEDSNNNEYMILLDILERASLKDDVILVEYMGYYVSKEDFEEFNRICRKLNVGIGILLNGITGEYARNKFNERLFINDAQYRRIVKYLEEKNKQDFTDSSDMISLDESKIRVFENMDELVTFYASQKDIKIEDLQHLIPIVGINNFNYLIDHLVLLSVIDSEDYANYKDGKLNPKK